MRIFGHDRVILAVIPAFARGMLAISEIAWHWVLRQCNSTGCQPHSLNGSALWGPVVRTPPGVSMKNLPVQALERMVPDIERELRAARSTPYVSLHGLWRGLDITVDEIDQAREEMWSEFPREGV